MNGIKGFSKVNKVYIIAEIGINHNGSLENCYRMIDASVESGCNAAKFQLFSAKNLYPKSAGQMDWKDDKSEYSYDIYEAVKNFELPEKWIEKLISYCESKNIDFMASVFDVSGLDYIVEKGMKIIKLSSYAITNIPLIEACAKKRLPIIMSTGGATLAETEDALNCVLKYHDNVKILHCSIAYPTDLKDINMGVLNTFKYAFPNIKYGYSDHSLEVSDAAIQSVYLGGIVLEKHITLNKKMDGPDHFFALEPEELKIMVSDIRNAEEDYINDNFKIDEVIYGSSARICYEQEKYLRDFAYMTLFLKKDVKKGEIIFSNDISILRPGKKRRGLEPKYLQLFKDNIIFAKKDILFEDPLQWEMIL